MLKFLRFLHNTSLIVHFGQETLFRTGGLRRASPSSNLPLRSIVMRRGAIPEPDGSSRTVPLSEVVLRTVFVQPQWLFHVLVRAMCPSFQSVRYGRRYGYDPKVCGCCMGVCVCYCACTRMPVRTAV